MKKSIIYLFKVLVEDLRTFAPRFLTAGLFFGLVGIGGCLAISGLIETYSHIWFGIPRDVCRTIFNCLMTILPLIPALGFLYFREAVIPHDKSQCSMELVFALWIFVVVSVWWP